jgi:gliding motility-associated-like protein
MKKQILTGVLFLLISIFAGSSYAANKVHSNSHDSLVVIAPNIFTPNGDGVNDTWSLIIHNYGVAIIDLQATVYDRWGEQVFNTTNVKQVWSGHSLIGKPCDDGTYFYVISYINGATGKNETFKGFLQLAR